MIFTATEIPGAYIVDIERRADVRGFFARTWCEREFAEHGLNPRLTQANLSYNHRKGTLRGMHYQATPHEEAKLVRCARGAIYDAIIDLRPGSPAYMRWTAVTLTADSYRMFYVPEGCAHGYLTLVDDCEVVYHVSHPYTPHAERGVRFDDPAFGIAWPVEVLVISEKDRSWPDFRGPGPVEAPSVAPGSGSSR
jgi:dTDP-4-dehydrorhamnose 3,5-epimerase